MEKKNSSSNLPDFSMTELLPNTIKDDKTRTESSNKLLSQLAMSLKLLKQNASKSNTQNSEIQIRKRNRDNSEIIFLINQ